MKTLALNRRTVLTLGKQRLAATVTSEKSHRNKMRDRKGRRLAGVEATVTVDRDRHQGGNCIFLVHLRKH